MPEKRMQGKKLVVSDAALPFIARGGRIFGKQVIDADLDITEGDEVLVLDSQGRRLAVAKAVD